MKTKLFFIALLIVGNLLQAQSHVARVKMDTSQACVGEIITVPVRIFGVEELGVSTLGFFFELKAEDTAFYEPVLITWDSARGMGQPLITNMDNNLLTGMLVYNYTLERTNYPLPTISFAFVNTALNPILFQDSSVLFELNFRLKKNITKPIHLTLKTNYGSHISWDNISNYELTYPDTARISPRAIPVVHAGPRNLSLTNDHDISLCAGQSVRLEGSGGVKYEWSLYPTKSNHFGYIADSTTLPIPVERIIANPHIPDPILIPYMPSDIQLLLTVTDEYGCVGYDSLAIFAQRHTLKIAPKNDTLIDKGETVQLYVNFLFDTTDILFKPYSFEWFPKDKLISDDIIDPYTLPLDNPTVFWVNVSDRWGCSEAVSTTVDVRGDSLFGQISKPEGLCAEEQGLDKQRITLSAMINGGYEDKTYEWSARKLHHGHEPQIVNPNLKTIEVDIYGQTEFTVYVVDQHLQKTLIIVDTVFTNTIVPVSIDIRYDDASAEQAEIGFCASMPITFLANYENGGNDPKIYWEINGNRVKNQTGTTLVWSNVNLANSVRAILYSNAVCPDNDIVYSNEINPFSEFYQLTGIDVSNITSPAIEYNMDSATLYFQLHNPGQNPTIKVYRNGLLYDDFRYTESEDGFEYKVETLNFWDRFNVYFKNETGNCLLMNEVYSGGIRPNLLTSDDIQALRIESDLGGDTICVDNNTVYTFRVKGMNQFDKEATVIWMVNDKEWGRYNYPAGGTNRLPQPQKHENAIEINSTLGYSELQAFDELFPFYFNKDHFPKTNVSFTAGDSLWAIVVGKTNYSGNDEYSIDTLPAIIPKFLPVSEATLDVFAQEGLSICKGESIHFSAIATNAGNATFEWYYNGEKVAENVSDYHVRKPQDKDSLRVVISSSFLCATNLPLSSTLQTIVVNELPQLVMPEDTIICSGTDLLLAVESNGTQFQWTANSTLSSTSVKQPTATPVDPLTVYHLHVTDEQGCENKDSIKVEMAPRIEVKVEAVATDTLICRGTWVRISANQINEGNLPQLTWFKNGYSILEPSIFFETLNIQDGDQYYCQLQSDVRSCLPTTVKSNVLNFKVNRPFTTDISAEKNVLCGEDSVMLIADGGRRFKWTTSDPLINGNTEDAVYVKPTQTTKYYLFADDGEVCTSKDSIEIFVDVYTPVDNRIDLLDRDRPEYCEFTDNTFKFRSVPTNGGLSPNFDWYVNDVLQPTWVDADISERFSDNDRIKCEMFASSDILSCASKFAMSEEITIKMLSAPVGEAFGDTNLCPGESTYIRAEGGDRYDWTPTTGLSNSSGDEVVATPTQTTNYIVKIIGTNECFIEDTVKIFVYDSPENLRVKVKPVQDSICTGDSMTLTLDANYTGNIRWFLNGTELSEKGDLKYVPQQNDEIYAILKAEIVCLVGDEVTSAVFVPQMFSVNVNIIENEVEICDSERYKIAIESNANQYLWMPKFAIEDVNAKEAVVFPEARHQSIDYVVRASIGNCSAQDMIIVKIKERPEKPVVEDFVLCNRDAMHISVNNPQNDMTYLWYKNDSTLSTPSYFGAEFPNCTEGLYYVKSFSNTNACASMYFSISKVYKGQMPNANYDVEVSEIKVKETIGVYNMSDRWQKAHWNFGDGFEEINNSNYVMHTYSQIGQFPLVLVVYSQDGCTDTVDNVMVNVLPQLEGVFVPTAFMPSAPHPEDQVVKVYGENLQSVRFLIFTQTGVLLFETTDANKGWDGTYQGRDMPTGNYTYQLNARKNNGQEIVQSGNVILIR